MRSVEEPADKGRRCLPSSAQSTQRNQPRQTLAVVDTNVLLQQLNLLGSLASAAPAASCPVVLVIPQVVRTELTGLSHSDDSERRAADVLHTASRSIVTGTPVYSTAKSKIAKLNALVDDTKLAMEQAAAEDAAALCAAFLALFLPFFNDAAAPP